MAVSDKNKQYVIGRGKLFFDQFLPETETKTGERYLGNTPALTMASAYTNLDHYDADQGVRVKDDAFQLQNDRSGTFQCDNIVMENVALMFGATAELITQGSETADSEVFIVQKGLYYQLGADGAVPDGVGNVSSVVVTDNSGVHASGSVTFAANPANNDTITVNGQVATFKTVAALAHEIPIGSTASVTAQNFKAEITAYPVLYAVNASGAVNVITLVARASGVGGNAITLAKSGANPTLSGATLTGGSASGVIGSVGNYELDLARGRVHILSAAVDVGDNDSIEIVYNVGVSNRILVVDEQNTVQGALRFISDNARGPNKDYYWPRTKVTPSGDYALKGEGWQTMTFGFEVLQPGNATVKRVYVREAA